MKRLIILLLSFLLLMPTVVLAEENDSSPLLTTCLYEEALYRNNDSGQVYGKVKVNIFTDGTSKILYENPDGDYVNEGKIQLFQRGEINTIAEASITGESTAYDAYIRNDNTCPYLKIRVKSSFEILGFIVNFSTCSVNGSTRCSASTGSSNEEIKTSNLTKICRSKLDNNVIDKVPAMDIIYRMYSDNKLELCLQMEGNTTPQCRKISKGESLSNEWAISTSTFYKEKKYSVGISKNQLSNVFYQTIEDEMNKTFTCPKSYIFEKGTYQDRNYEITTSKTEMESHNFYAELQSGSNFATQAELDAESSVVGDNGNVVNQTKCKTYEKISSVLRLIRIFGLLGAIGYAAYEYKKLKDEGEDDRRIFNLNNLSMLKLPLIILFVPILISILYGILKLIMIGSTC